MKRSVSQSDTAVQVSASDVGNVLTECLETVLQQMVGNGKGKSQRGPHLLESIDNELIISAI